MSSPTFAAAGAETAGFNQGTGATAVSKPEGTAENDFMLLVWVLGAHGGVGSGRTAPAGWTPIDAVAPTNFGDGWALYYKVAGASEPASYNVTQTTNYIANDYARILAWTGNDAASPIDATGTPTNADATTAPAMTSLSAVAAATTLIALCTEYSTAARTITAPSGMTMRAQRTSASSYNVSDLALSASGATGAKTFGVTGAAANFRTFGFTLKGTGATPPTLSGPTGTATGPTQATIGVTSDTAPTTTAISYQILPAATAAPSAATIVGAPDGTISTGSAGALTKAITGLTTNTAVKVHFAQGASSNVVSSASFTPNTLAIAGTALSAQSGTQGSAFSWSGSTPDSLISNHGNGAGSWSGSGLSGSGLSVNSSTGVLSGTCGAPAVYSATLTYTDSSTVPAAQTVSKAVTVTITALGGGGVTFAGTVPPKTGSAGSAFDFGSPALDSYFTGAGTYAAQSGSLGSIGLSIDANTGVISGATPIAGTQSVVIRKTAASGSPATADTNSFQITIEAAAVSDSGTILLPPVGDLRDGQEITIFSSLAVTALTVSGNGASVNGAPLALAANGYFRLKFNASSLAWYRIG